MNLTEAAQQPHLLKAALAYAEAGLSVIPLSGKRPTVPKWQPYTQRPASPQTIVNWWRRGALLNVGIVCGRVSGLIVIDLDGLGVVQHFEARFPDLCETYTVLTGSGRGRHVYLQPEVFPPSTRALDMPGLGNLEIKSDGGYVVAPPSHHPVTHSPYVVIRPLPVLKVADVEHVRSFIQRLNCHKLPARAPRPTGRWPETREKRALGFASAALESEVAQLLATPKGNQNNQLNRAAYSLGQLVADGLLPREQVERRLLEAALALGQPAVPSERTIRSGLEAGLKNPRSHRKGSM